MMIHQLRGYVLPGLLILSILALVVAQWFPIFRWVTGVTVPLLLLGIYDVLQKRHNILRNYPVLGHLRFMFEDAGPELHQYFVESNTSGAPFNRKTRSLMYERSKNLVDAFPFGTELDVYEDGYTFVSHSIRPKPAVEDAAKNLRVQIGGPECKKPYSASILNISAMSFGALGANAVLAMNEGARRGGFAHNTGEGGFSRHHRQNGGDIFWQVGTGYFGCRTKEGRFDPEMFQETAAHDQIKMIELKVSQGAKPGHGGILPGAKVTAEIAEARRVPVGEDCLSAPGHTAFATPIEMMEFMAKLRELADGKPVGFKLCVGNVREFMAIAKAMVETGVRPDFITVDGAEGGTGAAPLEFSDHLGYPLRDALYVVHNTLVGIGVRDEIRVAASGKRVTANELAVASALGADWCNTARGFMFSVGCIQAQSCHTNRCPVGVTTQDAKLQRALDVEDKAKRVHAFHHNTVRSLAEFTAAAGLAHPAEFEPQHIKQRISAYEVRTFRELYPSFEDRQLLDGEVGGWMQNSWNTARAETFDPMD
ncbi:FMN-binding glutamate synthase family protein [Myxococcota bacterium]|nr:FMN-binding glutamate synthase family protein [Myxococcota bacterium]